MSTVPDVSCRDGTFHTEYNRPATFKVPIVSFILIIIIIILVK